jgi:hypothetical protein
MFWEDLIPPKNRPVPLHIHSSQSQEYDQNPGSLTLKRRLLRVLSLSAQANLAATMITEHDSSSTNLLPSTVISQWTLLQIFILEAIKDIQPIFHSQLFLSLPVLPKDEDLFSLILRESLHEDQPHLPGVLNLLLHMMHATGTFSILFLILCSRETGVVLGIGLRAGAVANITLPEYFWRVLCNEDEGDSLDSHLCNQDIPQTDLERSLLRCCAHAIRHGVTSCVPEAYLDLITSSDLKMLLNAGGSLNVEILRSTSSYASPLLETDDVVEVFWLALSDLPRASLLKFLQTLWSSEHCSDHIPDGTIPLVS